MALSEKQVSDLIARRNKGESVADLAEAFKVSEAAVRYQLKKNGGDAETETDAELGIGVDDEADASANLAALMKNPELAKLIDAAVSARLAQMGSAPVAMTQTHEFQAFMSGIERLLSVQAIQVPGYIKPLSADEMERRAQGYVDMLALIEQYKGAKTAPKYLLGAQFYAGDELYDEGQEIRTYLPPAESFQPLNEPAARVYDAMMQWIGGETPEIGEQIAAAMSAAKNADAPLVTGMPTPERNSPVEVVKESPRRDVKPKRVAGTIVPETHGAPTPNQSGQPAGPVFVGP